VSRCYRFYLEHGFWPCLLINDSCFSNILVKPNAAVVMSSGFAVVHAKVRAPRIRACN
jgi:hypothetical protein